MKFNWHLLKRKIKFIYQKLTRGWSDDETWSLDYSLAKLIAPRLKRFKQIICGHPHNMEEKEWHQDLDKMIAAFEFLGSEDRWSFDLDQKKMLEVQEGIDLFAKHYVGLWW